MFISEAPFETLKSGTASKLESYFAKTSTLLCEDELDRSWLEPASLMNDLETDFDI
jgi:hypothetical protein